MTEQKYAPPGADTGMSEHKQDHPVVELASKSGVKITPVEKSLTAKFGGGEVIPVDEVLSGVDNNPYTAAETLLGTVNREHNMEEKTAGARPDALKAAIEAGVIPSTGAIADNDMFVIRMKGKLTKEQISMATHAVQFPEGTAITRISQPAEAGQQPTEEAVTLDQTPFNVTDNQIEPGAAGATFPDRAIVLVYDPRTDSTVIGLSRGVPFPADAVREAIVDRHSAVRVSEVMREHMIREGILNEDGDILKDGNPTGEKFDIQNPQRYLTNGELPREKQIEEIVDVVMTEVKNRRTEAAQPKTG